MKSYNSVEEYADHIRRETSHVLASMCKYMGPEHSAVKRVADLCTEAATIVNQTKMQQEQAGGYNLASLKVNADTPSNSETGWERED